MEQLLWSDPQSVDGEKPWKNSKRGAGIEFTSVVTKNFVEKNNLLYIIRSHQLVNEGYEFLHDNKLITIFSCSNYSGSNNNKGAVAVLKKENIETPVFVSYFASTFNEREINICRKKTVLAKLRERIFHHRSLLASHFTKKAKGNLISIADWEKTLKEVIKLEKVNWVKIRPYLANMEEDNLINFHQFLNRFQIPFAQKIFDKWNNIVMFKICEKIFKKFNEEAAFLEFDKKREGKVSYEDFLIALKKFEVDLSENQIFDLMTSMDEDGDGFINFEEFKKRFNFQKFKRENNELLFKIGEKLFEKISSLEEGFEYWLSSCPKNKQTESNNTINFSQFKYIITQKMEMDYSFHSIQQVFQVIDSNGDGFIDLEEFQNCFSYDDKKFETWAKDTLENLISILHKSKHQLKRIFSLMDMNNSGSLDEEEFKEAMTYINKVLGSPMTDFQVKKLFKVFDLNKDGDIEYSEFVDVLQIVDSEQVNNKDYSNVEYGYCESENTWVYFPSYINVKLEKSFSTLPLNKSMVVNVNIDSHNDFFVSFINRNDVYLRRNTNLSFNKKIKRFEISQNKK